MECISKLPNSNDYMITMNNSKKNKYFVKAENIFKPLGKGSNYTTYLATLYGLSDSKVVIKQMIKGSGQPIANIKSEIDIMEKITQLKLYNLVTLIEWCEDANFVFMVTPFYDIGSLTNYICQGNIKSEQEAMSLFRQICYGLHSLHRYKILHRNLCMDNILMCTDESLKLHIFIANYSQTREAEDNRELRIGESTKAPEVYSGQSDSRMDIYSLGCVLYSMLTQNLLFSGTDKYIMETQQKSESIAIKTPWPISELTMLVLEGCLQFDGNKRMTIEELSKILNLENLYSESAYSLSLGDKSISHMLFLKSRSKQSPTKSRVEINVDENISKLINDKIKQQMYQLQQNEISRMQNNISSLQSQMNEINSTLKSHAYQSNTIELINILKAQEKEHTSVKKEIEMLTKQNISTMSAINNYKNIESEINALKMQMQSFKNIDVTDTKRNGEAKPVHESSKLKDESNSKLQSQIKNLQSDYKVIMDTIHKIKTTQTNYEITTNESINRVRSLMLSFEKKPSFQDKNNCFASIKKEVEENTISIEEIRMQLKQTDARRSEAGEYPRNNRTKKADTSYLNYTTTISQIKKSPPRKEIEKQSKSSKTIANSTLNNDLPQKTITPAEPTQILHSPDRDLGKREKSQDDVIVEDNSKSQKETKRIKKSYSPTGENSNQTHSKSRNPSHDSKSASKRKSKYIDLPKQWESDTQHGFTAKEIIEQNFNKSEKRSLENTPVKESPKEIISQHKNDSLPNERQISSTSSKGIQQDIQSPIKVIDKELVNYRRVPTAQTNNSLIQKDIKLLENIAQVNKLLDTTKMHEYDAISIIQPFQQSEFTSDNLKLEFNGKSIIVYSKNGSILSQFTIDEMEKIMLLCTTNTVQVKLKGKEQLIKFPTSGYNEASGVFAFIYKEAKSNGSVTAFIE